MSRTAVLTLVFLLAVILISDRMYVRELSSYAIKEQRYSHPKSNDNQQKPESPFLAFIADVEEFIKTHDTTFIVLSTLAIAVFTGTLWRATTGLQDFAAKQAIDTRKSLDALLKIEKAYVFVQIKGSLTPA